MKKYLVLALVFVNFAFSQKELPNLSLKDINNENFNLKESFNEKDKLYVFSFWASWCSPCINELDELNDIQLEWKKTVNFEIIAVSTDDSRTQKRVKPLVNGKGWEYKVQL
jgi:peroxiredoxin